jgi:hypothetical protein
MKLAFARKRICALFQLFALAQFCARRASDMTVFRLRYASALISSNAAGKSVKRLEHAAKSLLVHYLAERR